MKAVAYRKNKGLVFENIPKPKLTSDRVLVKVANAGFCGSDHSIIEYDYVPDGHILGHEISGTIAEAGSNVNGVSQGERVIIRGTSCGRCKDCLAGRTSYCTENRRHIGKGDMQGGFAEYLEAYPSMLIRIPAGVDSRNAAMSEMFASSLHAIYGSGCQGGAALVIGGGPIGLALVALLKLKGFGPIMLSEPVKKKRDIGQLLGTNAVLDPFEEDIQKRSYDLTSGAGFDIAFECSGIAANVQKGIDCLTKTGVLSLVSIMGKAVAIDPLTLNLRVERRIVGSNSNSHGENREILDLMAEKKIDGSLLVSEITTLEELPGIYREKINKGQVIKVIVEIGEEF